MIGDDLDNDILGARHAGLRGVLVRTGKYRPAVLGASDEQPDAVIGAFADLPELLGLR